MAPKCVATTSLFECISIWTAMTYVYKSLRDRSHQSVRSILVKSDLNVNARTRTEIDLNEFEIDSKRIGEHFLKANSDGFEIYLVGRSMLSCEFRSAPYRSYIDPGIVRFEKAAHSI